MKKVIGIVSYLPDDECIRQERKDKLKYLIYKCELYFQLPFIIIAQNWNEDDNKTITIKNGNIYHYDKLGIVGARKKLREHFLNSEYNYLIMLDDDCVIDSTSRDSTKYLVSPHMSYTSVI